MERQFIYTCPQKIFEDNSITINELKIYMIIRSFMDSTGDAYPSNSWLAKKVGISPRKAIDNINRLVDKGYLERVLINGKRHLKVFVSSIIEHNDENLAVTAASPPHDGSVTPPMTAASPYYINSITSKSINNNNACAREEDLPKKIEPVEYQETMYMSNQGQNELAASQESFEEFWSIYPVKKAQARAKTAWYSQKCYENAPFIIDKLRQQIEKDRQFKDGYILNPDKYIHEERWKDEIIEPIKKRHTKSHEKNSAICDEDLFSTDWRN